MFIEAWFLIAKKWTQPVSTNRGVDKQNVIDIDIPLYR